MALEVFSGISKIPRIGKLFWKTIQWLNSLIAVKRRMNYRMRASIFVPDIWTCPSVGYNHFLYQMQVGKTQTKTPFGCKKQSDFWCRHHSHLLVAWFTEYDERYPNGYKKVYYKRIVLELFSPYLNDDGVVKRLTMYKNLDYTEKVCCWQWHRNRDDLLETIEKNFQTNQIVEKYASGRCDSLKCNNTSHIYMLNSTKRNRKCIWCWWLLFCRISKCIGFTRSMERDGEKTLEYYDKSRLDGLLKLEVGAEYVREYYEYRQNRSKISTALLNNCNFQITFLSRLPSNMYYRFLMFREFLMDKKANKNLIVSWDWERRINEIRFNK